MQDKGNTNEAKFPLGEENMRPDMEAFFLRCEEQLRANSNPHTNGQCQIWCGCTNRRYGQFRYRDPRKPPDSRHKTRGAHRMALLVAYRTLDVSPTLQASHLCNRPLCINPAHLVFERRTINDQRQVCFKAKTCTGHVDRGTRQPNCRVDISAAPMRHH
ncbi:hypothetical protein DPMN_174144 [Dreissena polymorpha]|uniref:Zinc-binding loop region of homing endonuclease domain-containing protein n=1 Tax=Dreissena polymorpha TaxID=45954 RepID=A0A9D4E4V3_DREPO|nr:hypothetical protein DPMN_174144 [Dreissena polymorpha]